MDVRFPVANAALPLSTGAVFHVLMGQHWHADDPVVREHPDMFSDDPRYGLAYSTPPAEMADPPAETAVAAPSGVRGTPYRRR